MLAPEKRSMHLNFADILNLVSTFTLIGALVFTALQVRHANHSRGDQAAITVLQTALSQKFGAHAGNVRDDSRRRAR